MLTLVTGGSKCGKSSYAEKILDDFPGEKLYIATMIPYGDEAAAAIMRHHKMREGKGFSTIECDRELEARFIPDGCGVLLECIGNLCANEMFTPDGIRNPVSPILRGISHLCDHAAQVVAVTNEVGEDGITYTPETMDYIRYIAEINAAIADRADTVIECVVGIPLVVKGEKPC